MDENRFGISLLSKENLDIAYLEEVMIDKQTGEVLVKTPEGDTISYNFNTRLKSHIMDARNDANNLGVYGNIYAIEFDGVNLPCTMQYNNDYITDPIIVNGDCKKLMIHTDIDPIGINSTGISYNRHNILIECVIAVMYDDNTISDTIRIAMSNYSLNSHVIDIYNINSSKNVIGIQLQSFIIRNAPMDFDDSLIVNDTTIRPICNSIFFVMGI